MPHNLPIAIIGAGPVGLAAAAHLLARGETPLVFEAGDAVAQSIRAWAHVRMFSPWGFNVDQAAAALLSAAGWKHPPKEALPTGGELVEQYLEPLASLPEMRRHIHVRTRVMGVTRKGYDKVRTAERAQQPFVVRVLESDGEEHALEAKAVIDASGTWASPNPAGADGLPAIGERQAADRIVYGIPDVLGALRSRYAGRTTMVVGSGHSALNALIELAELKASAPGTNILWVMRKHEHRRGVRRRGRGRAPGAGRPRHARARARGERCRQGRVAISDQSDCAAAGELPSRHRRSRGYGSAD